MSNFVKLSDDMPSAVPEGTRSTLPGWEDVIRVPQQDATESVVSIAYSDQCKYNQHASFILCANIGTALYVLLDSHLMDIFRAVLLSGEKSPRVLKLTADIIGINPGHYTVW